MKIIVDAMGGDNAPMAPVEAAVRAVKELDVEIVLVGQKEVVEKELSAYDYPNDKISIANADNKPRRTGKGGKKQEKCIGGSCGKYAEKRRG